MKKPAFDKIGEYDLQEIYDSTATSGNTFKAVGKKEYKIVRFKSEKKVKEVIETLSKFKNLVSQPIEKKGRWLAFRWVEGKVLNSKISNSEALLLGELYGKIHKKNIRNNKNSSDRVQKYLDRLKSIISKRDFSKIYTFFDNTVFSDSEALSVTDANLANFLVRDDQIIVIDPGAVNYNIKGRGIISILSNLTSAQKKKFWKGYEKFADSSWFTKKYEKQLKYLDVIIARSHTQNKYSEFKKNTWQNDKMIKAKKKFKVLLK